MNNPFLGKKFKIVFLKPKLESKSCKICKEPTTGNKPYCIEHIDQMPYVKILRAGRALSK